jgi:hypothetical protein
MMTALVVAFLWCCSAIVLSLVLSPARARQRPPEQCHSDWLGLADQHRFGALRVRPLARVAMVRTHPSDIW